MAVTPLLLADSIGKSFGARKVLSAASLAVHTGSVTVVLGRNGAGKSTLLGIAAGWLAADHGIVRFRGETYMRPRLHQLAAQGLFYLPTGSILSPAFSLREHLEAVQRRYGAGDTHGVAELLQIGPLLDRTPDTFSGGERRRGELAVALLRKPLCLLADEPLRGITPRDMEVIGAALQELARGGCGVVATGHEVPALLPLADQVVWITAGTSYGLGTPGEAERHPRFRREYLGLAETLEQPVAAATGGADASAVLANGSENRPAPPPSTPAAVPSVRQRQPPPLARRRMETPAPPMHIDAQTFRDLEIFECQDAGPSLFDLLNSTRTTGGRSRLQHRCRHPLTDAAAIAEVQAALRFILANPQPFAALIDAQQLREVDRYLRSNYAPIASASVVTAAAESQWYRLRHGEAFTAIAAGVERTLEFLRGLQRFCSSVGGLQPPAPLAVIVERIAAVLGGPQVEPLRLDREVHGRSAGEILVQDRLLRDPLRRAVTELIELLHELDALLSLAAATRRHGLTFPEVIASPTPVLEIEGLYHPFLQNPRRNDFRLEEGENLIFLTGPNMAGKTTYLRACGIALYLAHLGMGVPAARMRISTFDTLLSSISTADNVRLGYSYFYSEVRRVREIGELLRAGKRAFVLFDEIFRGTNVKDAFDASQAVITAFAGSANALFIVSSHLAELVDELRDLPAIALRYFDADLVEGRPVYSYRLRTGSSAQRLGLLLLEQDGVLELLEELKRRSSR